jgi:hypothetical protein
MATQVARWKSREHVGATPAPASSAPAIRMTVNPDGAGSRGSAALGGPRYAR